MVAGAPPKALLVTPEAALGAWLAIRGPVPGPLFCRVSHTGRLIPGRLTSQAVYQLLQRRSRQAGNEPVTPHEFRRRALPEKTAYRTSPERKPVLFYIYESDAAPDDEPVAVLDRADHTIRCRPAPALQARLECAYEDMQDCERSDWPAARALYDLRLAPADADQAA